MQACRSACGGGGEGGGGEAGAAAARRQAVSEKLGKSTCGVASAMVQRDAVGGIGRVRERTHVEPARGRQRV